MYDSNPFKIARELLTEDVEFNTELLPQIKKHSERIIRADLGELNSLKFVSRKMLDDKYVIKCSPFTTKNSAMFEKLEVTPTIFLFFKNDNWKHLNPKNLVARIDLKFKASGKRNKNFVEVADKFLFCSFDDSTGKLIHDLGSTLNVRDAGIR